GRAAVLGRHSGLHPLEVRDLPGLTPELEVRLVMALEEGGEDVVRYGRRHGGHDAPPSRGAGRGRRPRREFHHQACYTNTQGGSRTIEHRQVRQVPLRPGPSGETHPAVEVVRAGRGVIRRALTIGSGPEKYAGSSHRV